MRILPLPLLCIALLGTGSLAWAADYDFRLVSVSLDSGILPGKEPQPVGEFVFANTSKWPLKVFGVGEVKEGAHVPSLVQFQYKLKASWRAAGGAGFGETAPTVVTLAPGEMRTLRIPLINIARLSATGRVGLRAQRGGEILWSAPIEPQAFQLLARQ